MQKFPPMPRSYSNQTAVVKSTNYYSKGFHVRVPYFWNGFFRVLQSLMKGRRGVQLNPNLAVRLLYSHNSTAWAIIMATEGIRYVRGSSVRGLKSCFATNAPGQAPIACNPKRVPELMVAGRIECTLTETNPTVLHTAYQLVNGYSSTV